MTVTVSEVAFLKVAFTGNNGPGYITVPGVKVGDMLVVESDPGGVASVGAFKMVIDADDAIYQVFDGDRSDRIITGLVVRIP